MNLEEKIGQIESGLIPAIIIKGHPKKVYNIFERMVHYKVPGVSVAVINNAEIEWAKGYGVKEEGSNVEITPETFFQAASLSKPVVAMAALHLVEKGKLDLESEVNSRLKLWKIPENEFTRNKKVNLRMLLTHTSGLVGFGYDGYAVWEEIPSLLQILNGLEPANSPPVKIDIEPETRWRYSNGGYLVTQLLMMEATGMEFPELMQEIVFKPLGMNNSTYQQPLPSEWGSIAATGHRSDGSMIKGKWHVFPEIAAGGIWTTPSDLCLFVIELQKSLRGISNKVLSKEMTRRMLIRHWINFGLGILLGGQGDDLSFTFNGGNLGFRCDCFAYAERAQGAVIMTNSDRGDLLIREIYRGMSAGYDWSDHKSLVKEINDVNPNKYSNYLGVYHAKQEIRHDFDITITAEDKRLFASVMDYKFELLPEAEDIFFNADYGWKITFVKDNVGMVKSIRYFLEVGPGVANNKK